MQGGNAFRTDHKDTEKILQLEKKELVKSKYVKHVREMFHIDDNPNLQEQLQFEG